MGPYEVSHSALAGGGEASSAANAKDRARTLRSLARSLLAVAQEIDQDGETTLAGTADDPHGDRVDRRALLDRAAQEYSNRRQRRRFFPADLFGEPAWDLLLDLFQARLEDKVITVTSACIAADVPLSTALRWIGVLEQQGLVERSRNVSDHRSTLVRLTDSAARSMLEYTEGCLIRSRRAERLADETLFAQIRNRAA